MKILFWGSVRNNSGPDNVNKCIVKNLTDSFYWTNSECALVPTINDIKYLLKSDVVVISGLSRNVYAMAFLAKLFGKKLVYILHGYFAYESKINEDEHVGLGILMEKIILTLSNLILPVSKKFMIWFQKQCPAYSHKTKYLYNGIEIEMPQHKTSTARKKGSVVATGGTRPLKGNNVIAEVIETINGTAELAIYGRIKESLMNQYKNVKFMGNIHHDQFMKKLSESELLVINSCYEPYCLAVVEGLVCGCSVLISEVAGVTDILELEECDIIHDPMDKNEIREKILYLQQHPNNARMMEKLDIDEYSYANQVKKLEKMCADLLVERN